jgi:hypothetical protein
MPNVLKGGAPCASNLQPSVSCPGPATAVGNMLFEGSGLSPMTLQTRSLWVNETEKGAKALRYWHRQRMVQQSRDSDGGIFYLCRTDDERKGPEGLEVHRVEI